MKYIIIISLFSLILSTAHAEDDKDSNKNIMDNLIEKLMKDSSKTINPKIYQSIIDFIRYDKLAEIDSIFRLDKLEENDTVFKDKNGLKIYVRNTSRHMLLFPQEKLVKKFGIDSLTLDKQWGFLSYLEDYLYKKFPRQKIPIQNEFKNSEYDYLLEFSDSHCNFVSLTVYRLVKINNIPNSDKEVKTGDKNKYYLGLSSTGLIYFFQFDNEGNIECLHIASVNHNRFFGLDIEDSE